MKVAFKKSFERDLRRIRDKGLLKRVKELVEAVEKASGPAEITNLKKLKGGGNYFA